MIPEKSTLRGVTHGRAQGVRWCLPIGFKKASSRSFQLWCANDFLKKISLFDLLRPFPYESPCHSSASVWPVGPGIPGVLFKTQLPGPTPGVWDSVGLGGARECAFLTGSHGTLLAWENALRTTCQALLTQGGRVSGNTGAKNQKSQPPHSQFLTQRILSDRRVVDK